MSGELRREALLQRIKQSETPVSGTLLSKEFGVSRQVIVQDIALLKAQDHDIVATHFGYTLKKESRVKTDFCVTHTDEEIEDELTLIVDLGGKVENVWITHPVYGKIAAPMSVASRSDVCTFMEDFRSGKAVPLKNMTESSHYHLISADSEETLAKIKKELSGKGYLR